jgi:hypothetical protein
VALAAAKYSTSVYASAIPGKDETLPPKRRLTPGKQIPKSWRAASCDMFCLTAYRAGMTSLPPSAADEVSYQYGSTNMGSIDLMSMKFHEVISSAIVLQILTIRTIIENDWRDFFRGTNVRLHAHASFYPSLKTELR